MGRRLHPYLDAETGLRLFLGAVGDHPWATMGLILSYSGLLDWEVEKRYQGLALERGLIERAEIPAIQRAPRRFGLTSAGAALIGRTWSRAQMWDALLRAVSLDAARLLLTEWVGQTRSMVWSLSPFTVPAVEVAPPSNPRYASLRGTRDDIRQEKRSRGAGFRSVCLDGLACLRFGPEEYANLAVMVDPGGIKLDWFFHQFRSWYAWRRRREFGGSVGVFPTLVIVAANELRQAQLIRLWREAAPAGASPLRLRITTYAAMAHKAALDRLWLDERGQPTGLWAGLMMASQSSPRPSSACGGWWGTTPLSDQETDPPLSPVKPNRPKPSLVEWAEHPKQAEKLSARLARLQLKVSAQGRRLLERIGEYPLITGSELAIVASLTADAVRPALKELEGESLICHPAPDEGGYVLTWLGLAWLAAQAGHAPNEYAALMRWPMRRDEAGRPRYSAEAMLVNREHTRCILDFLIGLRRNGPGQRLALLVWDHVQCMHEFPVAVSSAQRRGPRSLQPARVLPDAIGKVRSFGAKATQFVDTDFWLEVDLGTKRGRALKSQLERFYLVGGPRDGLQGRAVRILMIVARDDEARLQGLRRRIRALNQRYHTQLDVRFTRLDLLEDERGRLDPARKVWRTPESSEFVYAFNMWEFPHKANVGTRGQVSVAARNALRPENGSRIAQRPL
jgi:hypothetical protein